MYTMTEAGKAFMANYPKFDEKLFLESMLLEEWKETYNNMTAEQKQMCRRAFMFGSCCEKQRVKDLQNENTI